MSLLKVKQISKTFKSKNFFTHKGRVVEAVKDISLSIEEGMCLGLVGESGCGKSTLGRIILGLEPPQSGQVIFQGKDFYKTTRQEKMKLRKDLQAVFQDYNSAINPKYPVKMAISEPLRNYLSLSPSEEIKRIGELLELVGLNPQDMHKYAYQFSGGQLQRVNIARALALNPKLIVLDEAVSSLDVSVQAQILNLLAELKRELNLSYLFISHDIEAVYYLADAIAVMYQGKLVEIINDISLFDQLVHPYSNKLLTSVLPSHPRFRTDSCVEFDELHAKPGNANECNYLDRCNCKEQLCFQVKPVLSKLTEGHLAACHKLKEINKA
ncbi:MAG: ABC transporter ATP-binding protein [Dethiobacter sp.]|jgi:nickel import ATP-binding protein NikE|nr:ABC transporter ATP-binding protein [Dethiobacter sp.]MBS3901086.1 ABC transporter ATP-binding protein [Dethiobacter sp.]MBS3989051.1 ABC transporter ATP-binding protein [Dethiobacter sp.]MCL4463863.1 ABC transporter ATP-binding protein [Bacillota bacterium]